MGLLNIFEGAPNTGEPRGGLLDSGDGLLNAAVIGRLLTARVGSDWPGMLMQAAQVKEQQQNQERLNRANDLQQLQGVYSILQNNEAMRWAQAKTAGLPYTPSPEYLQIQAKLAKLSGLGTLASPGTPTPTPASSPLSAQQAPGAINQNFAGASPDFNPSSLGRVPAQMPAPQAPQAQAPQAPQPQRTGFGAPAGGLDMTDYMMAANNPGLKMYVENYAKAHMPQNMRAGSTYVAPDANGNMVPQFYAPQLVPGVMPQRDAQGNLTGAAPIPGFAGANAAIKGAEAGATEEAKAPYGIHMVTTASGATVPMTTAQLARGAPLQAGGLPFVTPRSPQPGQAPAPPQSPPGVASLTVTEPSRQSQVPQPSAPQAANPQAANDPWSTVPTIPQPQGIGQGTYEKTLAEHRAGAVKDISAELGTNASAAAQRIAINNQAKDVVDRADTGWLANHVSDFRNVLATLGVKSAEDPAANDAILAKDLTNTALQKGKQLFGSRFTQSEVGIMLSRANPSPEMQKTAIKFLLDTDNATQQYAIRQSQDFGNYLGKNGDPLQFKGWYANAFPLTKDLEQIAPPGVSRPTASTPVQQGPLTQNQTALYMARQAIAQGKPRDAVRQRLIEQGFSPEGL